MGPFSLIAFVIVLVFSIVFHEVAHGYVAYKFGDTTAKEAGRLTLNPIPHVDLVGTIIVPGVLLIMGMPAFGWAKPVPVNHYNLYPRKWGNICVSLAGVAVNFVLAVSAAMIVRFTWEYWGFLGAAGVFVGTLLMATVLINLILGLLNLIPIPPLDGSRILTTWLPDNMAMALERNWFLGIFFVMILVQFLPLGQVVIAIATFLTGIPA